LPKIGITILKKNINCFITLVEIKKSKNNNNIINKNKEFEDRRDIDLVNNILNKKHRNNDQKLKKYCHICEMNHNTNECHFNMMVLVIFILVFDADFGERQTGQEIL